MNVLHTLLGVDVKWGALLLCVALQVHGGGGQGAAGQLHAYSFAGGGSARSSGGFSIETSTIADQGGVVSRGGGGKLRWGYVPAVLDLASPILSFQATGDELTLSWDLSGCLPQESRSLKDASWTTIAGGDTTSFTLSLSASGQRFFRLYCPD